MSGHLEELVAGAVKRALTLGATDAECTASEGAEFSVSVRKGEVDKLTEAGSKAVGLRVLVGQKQGSAYTSDLTREGVEQMVRAALELAQITSEDPFAGLPEPSELGKLDGDLALFYEETALVPAETKIAYARQAEAAALAADERIANSEGAGFGSYAGQRVFGNSRGFLGSYRTSSCSLSTTPVAKQGDAMERDYWYTIARQFSKLESPESVGRKAAARAVRRLGARKLDTQKAPVVFDRTVAKSLLDHIFDAASGETIYRKSSIFVDKLGETVASKKLTLVDDATLVGLFGTSPYDDEGVPSRRTPILENGVLKNYLLNTYTAKKLGMKTTGNASRGLSGASSISHGNLFLEPGDLTQEEIFKAVGTGLFVTELIGFGVNIVTGDYSRGAVGLWIEGGELAYPVSEITIAGNLKQMLNDVSYVGSDLEFRGSVNSPTLVIGEMTISGQ